MPVTPEFWRKVLASGVRQFRELNDQEDDPMDAYHHASYLLSELVSVLAEQLADDETIDAIGEINAFYDEIAVRAGVDLTPYEEVEEDDDEEDDDEDDDDDDG